MKVNGSGKHAILRRRGPNKADWGTHPWATLLAVRNARRPGVWTVIVQPTLTCGRSSARRTSSVDEAPCPEVRLDDKR